MDDDNLTGCIGCFIVTFAVVFASLSVWALWELIHLIARS